MNKSKFIEMQTKRLQLKQLKESDWEVISFLRSDKEVNKYVKRPTFDTKEKSIEFISKINLGIKENSLFYWSIVENKTNHMIGTICIWNFSNDGKIAEVGFELNPKFQGKGFMSESLKSILSFGFNHLQLELISAFTNYKNVSSKKILERNEFKLIPNKKDEHNQDNIVYELKKPVANRVDG